MAYENPLCSSGNSTQGSIVTLMEGNPGGWRYMYIYMVDSLCCEETQLKRKEETQLKLGMNQVNLLSVFKHREQHVCIHTHIAHVCITHTKKESRYFWYTPSSYHK